LKSVKKIGLIVHSPVKTGPSRFGTVAQPKIAESASGFSIVHTWARKNSLEINLRASLDLRAKN